MRNKFARLADAYPTSEAVTSFLRSPALVGGSYDATERAFLGQYVSQVKGTCVAFVQALLRLYSRGGDKNNTSKSEEAGDAGTDVVEEGGNGLKKQGNIRLVGGNLILFANCPQRKAGNNGSGKDGETAFYDQGRTVSWTVDPAQVLGENATNASQVRSVLLHALAPSREVDSSGAGHVLLFVRQDATPYVYCGRCSVLALTATAPAAAVAVTNPVVSNAQWEDTNNITARNSSAAAAIAGRGDSSRSAVKVLMGLGDYDTLWSCVSAVPAAGDDDQQVGKLEHTEDAGGEVLYRRMLRLHSTA